MKRLEMWYDSPELVIFDEDLDRGIHVATFTSDAARHVFMQWMNENNGNVLVSEFKREESN